MNEHKVVIIGLAHRKYSINASYSLLLHLTKAPAAVARGRKVTPLL